MSDGRFVDREIIRQIAVEEKRIGNPYSDFQTLVDKLSSVKPYLVSVARNGELTTYGAVVDECEVFTARQSRVLGILSLHEDEVHNPPLSAVVVSDTSGAPMVGEKYFKMVEKARNIETGVPSNPARRNKIWRDHLDQVYEKWQNGQDSSPRTQ